MITNTNNLSSLENSSPSGEFHLGKRVFSSDESSSLTKKICVSKEKYTLNLLELIANSEETIPCIPWFENYSKINPVELDNRSIIEAIQSDPDQVKQSQYLRKLTETKVSILCLSLSINPILELRKDKGTLKGYFELITLAFAEHATQQCLPNLKLDKDIKSFILEGLNDATAKTYGLNSKLLTKWKNDKPICITTGWFRHVTSLVIYKNFVAYGNKGMCHEGFGNPGIKFYKMTKPENFNENFLKLLQQNADSQDKEKIQKEYLENGKLCEELGLELLFTLPKSLQKDGYCTYSLCKLNFHALLILYFLRNPVFYHAFTSQNDLIKALNITNKNFNSTVSLYNLKQYIELLKHPLTKKFISEKDRVRIYGHIQTKFSRDEKSKYLSEDSKNTLMTYLRDSIINPIKITHCLTTFAVEYSYVPSIAKSLLKDQSPGSFILRRGITPQTIMLNYLDKNGNLKYSTIKQISPDSFVLKSKPCNTLQELFNCNIVDLNIFFMKDNQLNKLTKTKIIKMQKNKKTT